MIIDIRKADEFFYNNQPIKKLQDKQMPSLEREIHILFYKGGAGNGDRTRLTSLGSWDFTTKLCPQLSWKGLLSKSLCINYSTKKPFWQVLFHQNKKPASQRAFLLRATVPAPQPVVLIPSAILKVPSLGHFHEPPILYLWW